jgi:hypothetical protein
LASPAVHFNFRKQRRKYGVPGGGEAFDDDRGAAAPIAHP